MLSIAKLRARLIATFAHPRQKASQSEDPDEAYDVYSAALEQAQTAFQEQWCERNKVDCKLLVVAGETMCQCVPTFDSHTLSVAVRLPWDSPEVAEHYRLKHQLRPKPRFTISKPYIVASWKTLDSAYRNWRAFPDQYSQFAQDYPDSGGTYFVLTPVRFNRKRTFAIAQAYRKFAGGLLVQSSAIWKRTGPHHWQEHYLTTRLDQLGFC